MNALAAMAVAALGTYTLRQASVRAFASRSLPERGAATLRHAALAIIASITLAGLPGPAGLGSFTAPNLTALATAIAIARRSNVSITILVTAATYVLVELLAT